MYEGGVLTVRRRGSRGTLVPLQWMRRMLLLVRWELQEEQEQPQPQQQQQTAPCVWMSVPRRHVFRVVICACALDARNAS